MFDLIGAGISIISGVLGKSSADKEKKAAQRQAQREAKSAKKIGAAKAKMYDKQIGATASQYTEQSASVDREAAANINSLAVQTNNEIAAIDLKYEGAIKAYEITNDGFMVDRAGNRLMADAYREQEKQDLIQIQLGQDETERQLNENIRAAELQADYKRYAAKRSLESAATDARDYVRKNAAASATARAMQAASGVQTEGSPMLVEQARMTEMMIGVSRIMQEGDEEFMAHMQEVNEINQYVKTQKEGKDWNKIAATLNKKGVKSKTALELEGNKLAMKTIEIQEKASDEDLDTATKVRNLSIKTAQDLYAANKSIVEADAASTKSSLRINRDNTTASLKLNKYEAKTSAQTAASSAKATGQNRANAAQSQGTSSLVGGVSGALSSLQSGSTLSSLASKGSGKSWSLFR